MTTMTIHALDPEIEKRVRQKSRKERKSLNQTLKELLSEGVGLSAAPPSDHRSDFVEFAGVWSEDEQREFDSATQEFERIDRGDWQ